MGAYQAQQDRESQWYMMCQCSMELAICHPCVLPRLVVCSTNRAEPSDCGKCLIKPGRSKAVPPDSIVCGAHLYRCPGCGQRKARLTLLTPDRQNMSAGR